MTARSHLPVIPLGLLLLATLVLRPVAHGVPFRSAATFWVFVVLGIGLPGMALCWAGGLYRRDGAALLGQGLTLGMALHGLLLLAARALGVAPLADAFPLLGLACAGAVLRWRRHRGHRSEASDSSPAGAAPTGLLAVVVLACLMQPLFTTRLLGDPIPADLLFHAGNAAELRHRWPPEDPRTAGLPLNYPLLAYALPVAASRFADVPVADALNGLVPLFWIALLALQVYNTGRGLLGQNRGAVLGAAVVLWHTDPGELLGLGPGAFVSHLATGLYGSPSTACGLVLFASLAIVLSEVVSSPRSIRSRTPLLLVLGLAASLTKATVAPVIVAGTGLLALWAWLRRHTDLARASLVAAVLVGAAAAPFTLQLGSGTASYRDILKWAPGAIVWHSGFGAWVDRTIRVVADTPSHGQPAWLLPFAASAWLAGYLGLGGVGAVAFLAQRKAAAGPAWAAAVAAVCVAPALLLDAHGLSQLFFLYNGQVLLGVLAGGGIAAALATRPHPRVLLLALGAAALPSFVFAARSLHARPRHDLRVAAHVPTGPQRDYAAGLAWLRAHASGNAVLFADNPSLLLSAFGECRLYHETSLFTPRGWSLRWAGADEPFPERVELQEALLRKPDKRLTTAASRLFPAPLDLLVVADNVQSRIAAGLTEVAIGPVPERRLLPPDLFELEFRNRAMHVYRVQPATSPRAGAHRSR